MIKNYFTKYSVYLLIFLISYPIVCNAQGKGKIIGKITDASTGENLPGANVILIGTNYGVSSDRFGYYKIEDIPFGTYTLKVSYIGYKSYSTSLELNRAKHTINVDVKLSISAITLKDIVVAGLLQGQVKALNQQMNAESIENVLSREEMRKFPDLNTAEALQRVPGVNIQKDEGEGTFVSVRGTEPRLTTITVDGQKLATSDVGDRITDLGIINSSQLASIKVIKALTPDMDAEGIGGQVNLVTRSPFDYENSIFKIEAGGGYFFQGDKPQYRISTSWTGFIGSKKLLGYTVSGSYYQNNINDRSTSASYADILDAHRELLPMNLDNFRLHNQESTRDHFGISGEFEYRPNKNNSFYLRGMYNQKLDEQNFWEDYYRISSGRFMSPNTVALSRFDCTYIYTVTRQQLISGAVGGVNNFDGLKLDYNLDYSYGNQVYPNSYPRLRNEWQMLSLTNFIIDLSNPDYPQFFATNRQTQDFFADPSLYAVDAQEYRYRKVNDFNYCGDFNIQLPYNIFSVPAQFKAGAKFESETKVRTALVTRYLWKGQGELYMTEVATGRTISNFLGHYLFAPMGDYDNGKAFIDKYQNLGLSLEENISQQEGFGGNYKNIENVSSFYLMSTFNVGNLTILAGIRDEFTNTNYNGTKIFDNNNGDYSYMEPSVTITNYNNIFPYLHFKYKITSTTNVRFAFTKSISRPNYWDLAPYFWVDPSDGGSISEGNPDLKPTISTNFDLMFAKYFHGIGVISVGGFYKILDRLIYDRTFQQIGGQYDGYTFDVPTNAGSSKLFGFEINWQQQFTFLPGFLNGFGIYANYTKTKSKASLKYREWTVLPGQAGDVGNLGLNYEKYGFTARISLNFTSPVLVGVGEEPKYDTYNDKERFIDFAGIYKVFSNLSVFLNLVNLTNERVRTYIGVPDKPTKIEYYGRQISSGIRLQI